MGGGGRAGRIRGHRLRTPALLLASVSVLFCQPLLGASARHAYPAAVILATMLMLQFAMRNLHVPGVPLAALGMLLNAIVVVANGAMPVDLESADRAGVATAPISAGTDHNHVVSGTRDQGARARGPGGSPAARAPGDRQPRRHRDRRRGRLACSPRCAAGGSLRSDGTLVAAGGMMTRWHTRR